MCGIAGKLSSVSSSPVERRLLRAMADAVAHRGPDADGFYVGEGIGLGHRRLSIIDLATGQQPLANEDGTVWSSSTARSTTSPSCATELESRGPSLPDAFRHRGHRPRLRGVGRCAASSGSAACSRSRSGTRRGARLLLARDRLGIKPLYYAQLPTAAWCSARRSSRCCRIRRSTARLESRGARRLPDAALRAGASHDLSSRSTSCRRGTCSSPNARLGAASASTGTSSSPATAMRPTRSGTSTSSTRC